jgi:hypothetical protein
MSKQSDQQVVLPLSLIMQPQIVKVLEAISTRRVNRETRLRSLGFEDPTEEQRRKNLTYNTAYLVERTNKNTNE